jgi:type I restriction enzyme S subunit
MALSKIRLGDYIVRSTKNNRELKYGADLISGVTSQGVFAVPKGDPIDVNLKPYKIVNDGAFVYNPTRLNLGSIAYRTDGLCIVSHLYMVFYLNEAGKKIVNPLWLYIYFRRDEFLREVTFRNFGSQRPEFNFEDMSDIIIPLPNLPTQQKYVDIYNAMVANQQAYERGLDDLKLTCDAYIDKLKHNRTLVEIGDFIQQINNKNIDNQKYRFAGLSMDNYFIDSIADDTELDFTKYKIVEPNEYGAVLMKVGRDARLTIARNTSNERYLISPAYYTFRITGIMPEYFMTCVNRPEFERRGWFSCDTSARGSLSWDEFMKLKIPNATDEEQSIISELYKMQVVRIEINEKLKSQIKNICPILIKGSLEESR